jgi:dTDP-4-dehydrorhamnose reductase
MAALGRRAPDLVVNAAAYTAVDAAERDRERAFAVNATGANAVAEACAALDLPLIHISTDYVFDGASKAPYAETDSTEPSTVYGASKLEGERLVFGAQPLTVVLRTAWVYDVEGVNFVRTMLRLAQTREVVSVVNDQIGSPTFAEDFADAVLYVATTPLRFGIYHCAAAGEATWAEFAREVYALSRARGGPFANVRPIASSDYPTLAARPANSRLHCGKLAADYGVSIRPWREGLAACIDQIAAEGWSVE